MKKIGKLLKLVTGLLFAGVIFLLTISGGAHIVGKLNEIGEIPEGKAGELASYLLKWNDMVMSVIERVA